MSTRDSRDGPSGWARRHIGRRATIGIAGSALAVIAAVMAVPAQAWTVTTSTTIVGYDSQGTVGSFAYVTADVVNTSGSGAPTGYVDFSIGAGTCRQGLTPIGATISTAACNMTMPSTGTHYVSASFTDPGGIYQPSSDAFAVQGYPATVTGTAWASPSQPQPIGTLVTVTAHVTGPGPAPTPTGNVDFAESGGGNFACPAVPLSSGYATCTGKFSSAGPHSVTVDYSGDANYLGSDWSTSVTATPTSPSLSTSASGPSAFGQLETLQVIAHPATGLPMPTGTVTFNLPGGPVQVSSSSGTWQLATYSLSPPGSLSIQANYGGDSNYSPSTVYIAVTLDRAHVLGWSLSYPGSFVSGQSVQLVATVDGTSSPAPTRYPTGTVAFFADSSPSPIAGCGSTTLYPMGDGDSSAVCTTKFTRGSHVVYFSYGGDSYYYGTSSSSYPASIYASSSPTSLTLTPTSSNVLYGDPFQLNAVVTASGGGSGTPTGNVTFYDNGVAIPGCNPRPMTGGAASCPSTPSVGVHAFVAVYNGDGEFSTSLTFQNVTVRARTATALGSTTHVSVYGDVVTFTAAVTTVAPATGVPAGTVAFRSDGTLIPGCESVTLTGDGTASCGVDSLAIGSHNITAAFNDGTTYAGSTSSAYVLRVQSATTTSISSSVNPSVYGQAVSIPVTVAPVDPGTGDPDGTVTLSVDGTAVGDPVALVSGAATFDLPTLDPGQHAIHVDYSGSVGYAASSDDLTQTVTQATTTTAVTSTLKPAFYSQPVSIDVAVAADSPAPGTPDGNVTLLVNGDPVGDPVALHSDGTASFDLPSLNPGDYTVAVMYSGTVGYAGSSDDLTQTIQQATTGVDIALSQSTSTYGQPVSVTVGVDAYGVPGVPTGTARLVVDGTASPDGVTLDTSGEATIELPTLGAGDHSIAVGYDGTVGYGGATSDPLTLSVNKANTSMWVWASDNPVAAGQTTTLYVALAAVAPGQGDPTGTVLVKEGATTKGSGTVSGAAASVKIGPLTAGAHTLTVSYAGDANFKAAPSRSLSVTWLAPSLPTADLVMAYSGPTSVSVGANGGFTGKVTNNGPSAATSTVATFVIPAGYFSLVKVGVPKGVSCTGVAAGAAGTLTCSMGSLAKGASAQVSLTLKAAAPKGRSATLTATATSATTNDPTPADASKTLSVMLK